MTLDEYATQVAVALVRAYNNKDGDRIRAEFRDADSTLTNSNISQTDRAWFWSKVKSNFQASPVRVERQANSSLIALMQAIEQALAARGGK